MTPSNAGPELSYAQQRVWFLDQCEPDSAFYNETCAIVLDGPLDTAALARSFDAVCARHDTLRARFPSRDGLPIQIIEPRASIDVPVIAVASAADAEHMALELARQPFDLAAGPPIRARLLQVAPDSHLLVIVMHHIVGDRRSLAVLWRDIGAAYAAADPPPLAVSYADYAATQRRWLASGELDAQVDYWTEQLAGAPALLALPTDRPRPPVLGHRGALRTFAIPPTTTAALQAISRDAGVTMFVTLLAAFQTLLHRYTGQVDVVVGSAVANRNRVELESLIGFFANTLVLRSDLSGDPPFRELLARVRDVTVGAFAHQDVPFEALVEELSAARSSSYAPLFQVMFAMDAAIELPSIAGIGQRLVDLDIGWAKLDLTLSLVDCDGGLRGTVEFNTDLFDAATIERMIVHFENLISGIAANPDAALSALPLLGDAERTALITDRNATARPYPTDERVFERIERQAAAAPDRIAVVSEGASLTYGELNARANQLAHHLQALGVGRQVRVGVAMQRSVELVISLLAIMKTGAAYVPLDPSYPRERLEHLIDDARPRVVLIQEALRKLFEQRVLAVDTAWPEIARQPTTNLGVRVERDALIYVMYISGTTGGPRGVASTHGGTENHFHWYEEQFDIGPADRIACKTPFGFDASVWELFLPLAVGATVVLARPGGHKDPAYIVELIARERITIDQLVPSMLAWVLETDGVERCTSLRHMLVGGETLPRSTARRFLQRLATAALHNLYGPTEASVDATHWQCGTDEPPLVPIGRPIGNVRTYVLDPHLEPTPIGVTGEIYIGGAGLARGYLDRPALTAERFVPDPFQHGERLYKTGDLGRLRADGAIELAGRIDHQVKLRGFRIEPAEVEEELTHYMGVREAIVMIRTGETGEQRLVAYVAGEADARELRDYLEVRLPDYMVPSAIAVVEALPRSPNGKIDRAAVAQIPLSRDDTAETLARRTPPERELARIYAELRGRRPL